MITKFNVLFKLTGVLVMVSIADSALACPEFFKGEYRKLHSKESVDLCQLAQNKTVLVVNTASHCGFTSQFKGLEALHKTYKDKGLVVVGFASDDFNQEDKSEEKAASICFVNFGVTFTMLAPTHVLGEEANDLFKYLGKEAGAPKWNFNKYLVGKDGKVIQHFGSMTGPDSGSLKKAIEQAL
jgi:glutathione peroxidase